MPEHSPGEAIVVAWLARQAGADVDPELAVAMAEEFVALVHSLKTSSGEAVEAVDGLKEAILASNSFDIYARRD